jgi:hypothetical protein
MSGEAEALFRVILALVGWPLRAFFRWLDRQPHRDPSQISTLHKMGRLALGAVITLAVLVPLGWVVFR